MATALAKKPAKAAKATKGSKIPRLKFSKPADMPAKMSFTTIASRITDEMIDKAERRYAKAKWRRTRKLSEVDRACVVVNAQDRHLLCRALAAYFTEQANDANALVDSSVRDFMMCGIAEAFLTPDGRVNQPVEGMDPDYFCNEVDDSKAMPVVEIELHDKKAKYRYNPKADKLQRCG